MKILNVLFGPHESFPLSPVGVLVRTWANAIGNQRLLARTCVLFLRKGSKVSSYHSPVFHSGPWNHLLFGMVGGYVGYNYSSWEAGLLAKVNEKRALRNLPEFNRQSMALSTKAQ